VEDGKLPGVSSAEVVQEVLHRYRTSDRPDAGERMARDMLDLFPSVLPITHEVMARAVELYARYTRPSARDIVHAATCIEANIAVIISTDQGFDEIEGLRRADPTDKENVHSLCR
jgi:predicted nucleic acid-binding protein